MFHRIKADPSDGQGALTTSSFVRTARGQDDLDFQAPYVHSSLLKLRDEIASLNEIGIPNSRIILVGFSQGAILVNSYLLRTLQLLSCSGQQAQVDKGELTNPPLPLPRHFLSWAGTSFSFETTFPDPGWPSFPIASEDAIATSDGIDEQHDDDNTDADEGEPYSIWCHQQCGSSDRYFSQSDIEAVAKRISQAGQRASEATSSRVRVTSTAEMEPGVHSVLPGMTAMLIQMVQRVASL